MAKSPWGTRAMLALAWVCVLSAGCVHSTRGGSGALVPPRDEIYIFRAVLAPKVTYIQETDTEYMFDSKMFQDCATLVAELRQKGYSHFAGRLLLIDAWKLQQESSLSDFCTDLLRNFCLKSDIDLFAVPFGTNYPDSMGWRVKSTRSQDVAPFVVQSVPPEDIDDGGPQPNLTGRGVKPHIAEQIVRRAVLAPPVLRIVEIEHPKARFETFEWSGTDMHWLVRYLREWGYATYKGRIWLTYIHTAQTEETKIDLLADFCRANDIDLFVTTPEIKDEPFVRWEVQSSRAREVEPFGMGPGRVAKAAVAPEVVRITQKSPPEQGFTFDERDYPDARALIRALTEQRYTLYKGKMVVRCAGPALRHPRTVEPLIDFCRTNDIDLFAEGEDTEDKPYVIWKVRSSRGKELERFLYRPAE